MQDLFKLIEIADECLKFDKQIDDELIIKIHDIVKDKKYIGIAQINTRPGNIEYNAKKISRYIKFADNIGLESLIFPELSLTGYPLEDTIKRHNIIVKENIKWLKGLAKIVENTVVYVGFTDQVENKYYNSVAVIQHGTIQDIIRKSVIPCHSVTNDAKYFCTSDKQNSFSEYSGCGLLIGDDIMSNQIQVSLKKSNPKLIINPSAQVLNGNIKQNHIIKNLISEFNVPYVYVNQVGANDNLIYEGLSCVYNSQGKLIAKAKAFEEQLMIVNPYDNIGCIYSIPSGCDNVDTQQSFTLDYEQDMERTYKALVLGVKDYFSKCGLKRAVLGLSGGLDSSVCAVILADALGKNNVYGISMPSHITSNESKSDAEKLAHNLGINYAEAPIREMTDTTTDSFNKLFSKVELNWNDRYKKSFTPDNIQARSRAMYLWGVSNEFPSCIPIATSDKSEAYMGYATINGDMSGGFAPIADITKTKLFSLARWLNKNRVEKNAIPETIIQKRPGAELAINPKTGKPLIAEDALMPYEFLDEIIWRIENNQETYQDMLESKFLYEKQNVISKDQKIEWLDKFYNRMSKAFYKWYITPPFVMVEPHSINHVDYKQPITSCGINYKGVSEDYINESLA